MPALTRSCTTPKIIQLYLSCLAAGVQKLTRCHGHQNYGPQLLGWSQGVEAWSLVVLVADKRSPANRLIYEGDEKPYEMSVVA